MNKHDQAAGSAVWARRDGHSLSMLTSTYRKVFGTFFRRYVIHRGDKTAYLRSIGVRIGDRCQILTSVQSFGSEPWLIEIGSGVTVTAGVFLITHDGASRIIRERVPGSSPWGNRFGPIRVLDNSFIGVGSVILPDVTIGPNSIVGAGSVVSQDVPPDTVVAGSPARVICSLDEYQKRYVDHWVTIASTTREELRGELTEKFFGERR